MERSKDGSSDPGTDATRRRHSRIKSLFLEACALEGEERTRFLDDTCEPALRGEVDELLSHHQEVPEDEWLGDADPSSPRASSRPGDASRSSGAAPLSKPTVLDLAAPRSGGSLEDSSSLARKLTPGTLVAGRYRIVARLGGGGMGEVYRAEDLVLQETVALKFLLPSAPGRWLDEVRLARQVTHPNVCRVFDVGEIDDRPFISMEYVDGENLASLLNRIGRLPRDRTVFIARQLFSGLAAAHAKGVLHRDLKPANIMIDGRGEVRITDFGIASRDKDDSTSPQAGTPAYMAPEQFFGQEVTARTDLYSLGLVLYELSTGLFPFDASSRFEYAEAHIKQAPTPPSSHVEDLDPTLERVILKCLEKEPNHRPSSALAVAAALPGGDPLRLAVAIGETPSPEMVAEAGSRGVLGTRAAAILGSLTALLLACVLALADPAGRLDVAGLDLPPEVLAEKAREKLRTFGWEEAPQDEAFGFLMNDFPLQTVRPESGPPDPSAPGASSILFWYRGSPRPMEPSGLLNLSLWDGKIGPYDPPLRYSGMVLVLLHPSGSLDHFEIRPPSDLEPAEGSEKIDGPGGDGGGDGPADGPGPFKERVEAPTPPDPGGAFSAALRAAGLDGDRMTRSEPTFAPPFFADARAVFRGTTTRRPDLELDVRVASYGSRLVYFRMIPASEVGTREKPSWLLSLIDEWIEWWDLLLLLSTLAAVPLMRRNLRRGRGDQRSARRLAGFVFVAVLGLWLVRGPHLADIGSQMAMLRLTLGKAMVSAGFVYLFYLALEPYVRRLWPHTLIAWTRLLSGRFTDPLVGRSVLYGVLFGISWALLNQVDRLLPGWLGLPYDPQPVEALPFDYASSATASLAGIGEQMLASVFEAVFSLLLLLLLRLLLRQPWAAVLAYIALVTTLYAHEGIHPVLSWLTVGLGVATGEAIALVRFGLVTYTSAAFVAGLLLYFPITLDITAWYANTGLGAVAVVALLSATAMSNALARSRRRDGGAEHLST